METPAPRARPLTSDERAMVERHAAALAAAQESLVVFVAAFFVPLLIGAALVWVLWNVLPRVLLVAIVAFVVVADGVTLQFFRWKVGRRADLLREDFLYGQIEESSGPGGRPVAVLARSRIPLDEVRRDAGS